MGIYCDSKQLERNWFNWLLSAAVPGLEKYRRNGLVYTKILGTVTPQPGGPQFLDPTHAKRWHCLALRRRVFVASNAGKLMKPVAFKGSKPTAVAWPAKSAIPCTSSIDHLLAEGYIAEVPQQESWDKVLVDVRRMCEGIVSKFNIPDEDNRADLTSEAFMQVANKIKTLKLVYIPGKAPVFNLLTTTIHRIIFSILNKDTRLKQYAANLRQHLLNLTASGGRDTTKLLSCDGRRQVSGSVQQARLFELLPHRERALSIPQTVIPVKPGSRADRTH